MKLPKIRSITCRIALCLLFVWSSCSSFSQEQDTAYKGIEEETEISLLVSLNIGKYAFGEIGIGKSRDGGIVPHSGAVSYYLSSEIQFSDRLLVGPKLGIHSSGGLSIGLALIYYTDFNEASLVFRPDFGIGMLRFKMAYGYNARLTNKEFGSINRHLFTVATFLRIKKLKTIRH